MTPFQFQLEEKKRAFISKLNTTPSYEVEEIDHTFYGDFLVVVLKENDLTSVGNVIEKKYSSLYLFSKNSAKVRCLKKFCYYTSRLKGGTTHAPTNYIKSIISVKKQRDTRIICLAMSGRTRNISF